MMMNDESFLELEVEEQLFVAVVHSPFEECEKLLLPLQDVNIKSGSGRSLLHVAVRLGKLDWVEGLLGRGADPSLVDNKGFTVLEVAEDMAKKRPKDDDLKMILRFVRVASEVGRYVRENVDTSAGKSSAVISELKRDFDLRNEISSLQSSVDELRKESATQIGDLRQDLLSSSVRDEISSSLQDSLDQLRKDTATQIGDLRQDLLSYSVEISSIKENIQSLTACVSSAKRTSETARGDIVILVDELSQRVISSGIKISSVKQNLDSVSADTSFMRQSLDKLQSDITSLAGEVTSLKSVLGEVKREVHSVVTRRESDTSGQFYFLKKAVEEVGRGLTSRDTLLEALETSITSMAERLAPSGEENKGATTELQGASNAVEESKGEVKGDNNRCDPTTSASVSNSLQATVSSLAELIPKNETLNQMSMLRGEAKSVVLLEEDDEEFDSDDDEYETDDEESDSNDEEVENNDGALTGTASGFDPSIIQTSDEKDCIRCVEAMTKKTWIYNDDNDQIANVRRFYRIIYQASPLTSCVLSLLAYHPLVGVSMDFTSSKVANMKNNINDHDGSCYNTGVFLNSVADFVEKRVYVGGLVERCERSMLGYFMKSLTQLALLLLFNNMGRPYFQHDEDLKVKVREIYDEAHSKKYNEKIYVDWFLHKALMASHDLGEEMLLIAAVPAIIVKFGSEGGSKLLDEQVPSLLDFYIDHMMPEFHNASIKLQKGS